MLPASFPSSFLFFSFICFRCSAAVADADAKRKGSHIRRPLFQSSSRNHALEERVDDFPLVHFLGHEVRADGADELVLGGVGRHLKLVVASVTLERGGLELVKIHM